MKRIVVEHISKIYNYQQQGDKDMSFRELLISQVTSLFKSSAAKSAFYALDDVSFDVQQGEVLGIIGKNGSGKSTLLKILSKVTTPTSGKAIIRGRVASLLEVGTGFHAELSGRENIFLSGIILGMKRWEINKYFDEIVAFADVSKFLDTPVKRYSSGMRLRLAFSVAVYLQPEVLLIDEVLAVGDYEFEKKCLESVNELGKTGRSVIFISHNLLAIKRLCSRVMVLENGRQKFIGDPTEATKLYLGGEVISSSEVMWPTQGLLLDHVLALYFIKVLGGKQEEEQKSFFLDEPVSIEIGYRRINFVKNITLVLSFYDETETLLFSTSNILKKENISSKNPIAIILCTIPRNIFQDGIITVGMSIFDLGVDGELIDFEYTKLFVEKEVVSFFMKNRETQKVIESGSFWQGQKGKMKPLVAWNN